jgi:hypothetical protein
MVHVKKVFAIYRGSQTGYTAVFKCASCQYWKLRTWGYKRERPALPWVVLRKVALTEFTDVPARRRVGSALPAYAPRRAEGTRVRGAEEGRAAGRSAGDCGGVLPSVPELCDEVRPRCCFAGRHLRHRHPLLPGPSPGNMGTVPAVLQNNYNIIKNCTYLNK